MAGNFGYDDISAFSRGSGGSELGSLASGSARGGSNTLRGKKDKHGSVSVDGLGKGDKKSGRRDDRDGGSCSLTSGMGKDSNGKGRSRSVKSSSSSVVTSSSRARS